MKKIHLIFSWIITCLLTSACEKKEVYSQLTYNQKANELIQQIVTNSSCGCILEIQNKSMIKLSILENPSFDIRVEILKRLHLKNSTQLDSLEKISENFILDTQVLKQKNIQIINKNSIFDLYKNHTSILIKKCPNGILYFSNPILNLQNKTAAVSYGWVENCTAIPFTVFKYKDKKWIDEN